MSGCTEVSFPGVATLPGDVYLPLRWVWRPDDPLAARLVIRPGSRDEVVWLLAVESLAEVLLRGRSGCGDVVLALHPCRAHLVVMLRSPSGRAVFATDVAPLNALLAGVDVVMHSVALQRAVMLQVEEAIEGCLAGS